MRADEKDSDGSDPDWRQIQCLHRSFYLRPQSRYVQNRFTDVDDQPCEQPPDGDPLPIDAHHSNSPFCVDAGILGSGSA